MVSADGLSQLEYQAPVQTPVYGSLASKSGSPPASWPVVMKYWHAVLPRHPLSYVASERVVTVLPSMAEMVALASVHQPALVAWTTNADWWRLSIRCHVCCFCVADEAPSDESALCGLH